MRDRIARIQVGLALVMLSLLTLIAIEVGARLIVGAMDALRAQQSEAADPRSRLPAYASATYDAEELFREERAADRRMYRPYVVWSRRPYDGRLISIDEHGERRTPPGEVEDPELVVWMLGGSTTWGMGAPDDETIPSHLARLLTEREGLRVRVRNLGEIGFVTTQEIVRLLREMQRGGRPDLVVFFDGVNDAAAAALWPEIPGAHMNFQEIRDRFERRGGPPPAWRALVKSSGLYRLARRLAHGLGVKGRPAPVPWDPPTSAEDIETRGRQAVDVWLENTGIVRAFARAHDFETLFVMQPSLMVGRKPLDPSEREILESERANAAKLQSMDVYRYVRDALRRREGASDGAAPIIDLSDAFAGVETPLYFDYVHISGEGNRILAARIHELILQRVCGGARPFPNDGVAALCGAAERSGQRSATSPSSRSSARSRAATRSHV
jgi:hypothetical protein